MGYRRTPLAPLGALPADRYACCVFLTVILIRVVPYSPSFPALFSLNKLPALMYRLSI